MRASLGDIIFLATANLRVFFVLPMITLLTVYVLVSAVVHYVTMRWVMKGKEMVGRMDSGDGWRVVCVEFHDLDRDHLPDNL